MVARGERKRERISVSGGLERERGYGVCGSEAVGVRNIYKLLLIFVELQQFGELASCKQNMVQLLLLICD